MKIHIMGASGAGKTYLGKKLAERLNYQFIDTDDIIWRWGEDAIPYTIAVPDEESNIILGNFLDINENAIVSGLFYPWAENHINKFDLLIYLKTSIEERRKRLVAREIEMYGDRVNGDMKEQFESFLEWACQYDYHTDKYASRIESEKWIKKFSCPVIYLDGAHDLEYKLNIILKKIYDIKYKNTPCYIFDLNEIKKNCQNINKSLPSCKLFYALKANGDNKILETISKEKFDFEIASTGEYKKIRKFNKKCICSLPIKSEKIIKDLYNKGCNYFVYDSPNELNKIKTNAPLAKKILRIDITKFKDNIMRYGMTYDLFEQLISENKLSKDDIDGLTFYLANNYNITKLKEVLIYLEKYLKKINKKNLIINLGGNYRTNQDVGLEFYHELNDIMNQFKQKYDCIFYAEPGHAIVRSSGKFITNVISVERKNNEINVFIDSGSPHGLYMTPKKIECINKNKEIVNDYEVNFYGMLCDNKLIFKTKIDFNIEYNDKLLFHEYGSYTLCHINEFHGWNKPKIYYEE